MARRARRVEQAVQRWLVQGLVTPEQAEVLRREEEAHHARATRRWGQVLVASLGAVALILAAVLFANRNWGELSEGARTGLLLAMGTGVYGMGLVVFRRAAWHYSGALLQTAGLGVVLFALFYSSLAWPDRTMGAVAVGLAAFAVPAVLAPLGFREGVLMAAVHTAFSFGYLAAFLDRTFGMDFDAIAWALDGVVLVAVAVFWVAIRRWPTEYTDRALVAFAVSLWAGLVLALLTGLGPLNMEDDAVLAMDVWLLLITGITLWGIHRSPSESRRDAYEINLALCVGVGGLLAMFTAGETWDLAAVGAAASGALVGGAGVGYGLVRSAHPTLITGALVILLATWVFAIDQAGAFGGVLALVLSAGALFWLSTRIRMEAEGP
ncbi:MAG: DUF2157 domain-containing protein [Longimicrobiales bacterium]|nr:DUF2157 domain-containing protein [Longimicrobiales bacterium]